MEREKERRKENEKEFVHVEELKGDRREVRHTHGSPEQNHEPHRIKS